MTSVERRAQRVTVLVVYESMFGSTQQVAESVAEGLSQQLDVHTVEVGTAPVALDPELSLLVVAAPTHALSLSRPSTRQTAATRVPGPLVSAGCGLREWLCALPHESPGSQRLAAAVTTRTGPRWLPGSAARAARRRLHRKGFRVVASPEAFWVAEDPGEPAPGELERARTWGMQLADQVRHLNEKSSWARTRPGQTPA